MRGFAQALAVTWLAFALPAAAQELLPGARLGMSAAEIQRARNGADALQGATAAGHEEGLLERDVSLAGQTWDARYYFAQDGLSRIVLAPGMDTPPAAYQEIFDAVIGEFGARFGEPFTCAEGPFVGKQECDWRQAGSRIGVQLVTSLRLLEITYSRQAS